MAYSIDDSDYFSKCMYRKTSNNLILSCNDAFHWRGANLESALNHDINHPRSCQPAVPSLMINDMTTTIGLQKSYVTGQSNSKCESSSITLLHKYVKPWNYYLHCWPFEGRIHRLSLNSLQKGPVMRHFAVDLNKMLNKQSNSRRSESPDIHVMPL